ncbi:ATP-binding protein [Gordonia sp. LSe1-13]|uniref:ATP-binding protein n=1 Tax=Gordonia sesuvii TaxID=3116777 RepID=A0ABU7MC64_9ACTN|nr:ATP-binding protein [Gordonia sp. LSe1-13]
MNDNLWYLRARIELVEDRIREVIGFRRSVDPTPDDPFRGLYIGDATVDALLEPQRDPPLRSGARATVETGADARESAGAELRLRRLARTSGLSELDVELLLICALPEIDARWERLYGYLNDDVSRRRASPDLAFALSGRSSWEGSARARLAPSAPLVDLGLVVVDDTDRPFLTRTLRVPDRVVDHLLGEDGPDPLLVDVVTDPGRFDGETAEQVARALRCHADFIYVRDDDGSNGSAAAAAAIDATGRPALTVDARRLPQDGLGPVLVAVRREAVLREAVIVLDGVHESSDGLRRSRLFAGPAPLVVVGRGPWEPELADRLPLTVHASPVSTRDRLEVWRTHVTVESTDVEMDALAVYALTPEQIGRAVDTARRAVAGDVGGLRVDHLLDGARMLNSAGLQRLARRVTPEVDWSDLVLPEATVDRLGDLAGRARFRRQVLGDWRMRRGGARGHGVVALFAGDSGTGKTMAAEVLAGALGLDLYTVDLASVVSKWIGETEKNLDRIFAEAESVNGVLLFDEADALFGKRSEVRDAQDRYANVETAYLLQRLEAFRGLAILTTNLRANLDDAFTRRLDAVIEFPRPDEDARRELWRHSLAAPVPCAPSLDIDLCARTFAMSGGNIRSAAVTAAYRAAAQTRAVTTDDLVHGVEQEYRKMGRLIGPEFAEFSAASDAQSA